MSEALPAERGNLFIDKYFQTQHKTNEKSSLVKFAFREGVEIGRKTVSTGQKMFRTEQYL